jgi:hypothetical protein
MSLGLYQYFEQVGRAGVSPAILGRGAHPTKMSKQEFVSLRHFQGDEKADKLFVTLSVAKGLDSSVAYRLPQNDK